MGRYTEVSFTRDGVRDLPERQGLYIIEGPLGTPIYVGKSKNVRRRLLQHLNDGDIMAPVFTKVKVRLIQNWKELERVEKEKIWEFEPGGNQIRYGKYPPSAWERIKRLFFDE